MVPLQAVLEGVNKSTPDGAGRQRFEAENAMHFKKITVHKKCIDTVRALMEKAAGPTLGGPAATRLWLC